MMPTSIKEAAPVHRRRFLTAVGTGMALLGATRTGRAQAGASSRGAGADGIPGDLPSAIDIDVDGLEVTLPMYRGRGPGDGDVYYVLTEATSLDYARGLGLNWAPKLTNALGTDAVQEIETGGSHHFNPRNPNTTFEGTVDFSGERDVVPNPDTGFPPDVAEPGATGDGAYSPFIKTPGGERVFNAPHVSNDSGDHDHLVSMDTDDMTATLDLVQGFYEDREVFYLTTDAYPALVAALEGGTFVPNLSAAPAAGDRDLETSAREAIFPVVNGPPGQGLQSALQGNGGPRNVTRSEQVCDDPDDPTDCSLFYSPLWDLHPLEWVVPEEERTTLTDHEEIIELVLDGDIESFAADGPVNTLLGNIRALDAAVNCPFISVEVEDGDGGGGNGQDGNGEDGDGAGENGQDGG